MIFIRIIRVINKMVIGIIRDITNSNIIIIAIITIIITIIIIVID
jgi:hypothetical protein